MKFHFPYLEPAHQVPPEKWNDWGWQMRNSATSQQKFSQWLSSKAALELGFAEADNLFKVSATPYYLTLAQRAGKSLAPLLRIFAPTPNESLISAKNLLDPLAERANSPAPRIIHRYADRILFLVTDICSVYCRYCTRKHFTGKEQALAKNDEYVAALQYIATHKGVREVILSGGDPLTLSDLVLERILSDLRKIDHLEIIRIGTRMPVVCPMRVSQPLVEILKKYKPIYLMTHFNHPAELTAQAAYSIELFVDNGVPVMNQMVILNGVNNHTNIVQALSRRLLFLRAKPYYAFQCDPSEGTDHLRTSVQESSMIQKELWGHLSGLAMPHFSLDIPGGGGKIPLQALNMFADNPVKKEETSFELVGFDGITGNYQNPSVSDRILPEDYLQYQAEWEELKSAKL